MINPSRQHYILVFAFLVFIVTANFSLGFFHPDEHYQIIEFAQMKLGKTAASDLPWEYEAKVRPTIQVFIAMGVFAFLDGVSVTNPYAQAFALRLLTSLIAFLVILNFYKKTKDRFGNKHHQSVYLILSFFLGIIPFLSARFSSEIWSGLLLLHSLSILMNRRYTSNKRAILFGVFTGMSFLFRFQIITALIGLLTWILFKTKERKSFIWICLSVFFLIVLFGISLDSVFYDEVVFTQYNYLYENLINQRAQNYGVSPWYEYLIIVINEPTIFFGLPVFFSLVYFVFRYRSSRFTWMLISFLLLHSLIAHKESRFLFPMVFYLPLMITTLYRDIHRNVAKSRVVSVALILYLSLNAVLVGYNATKGTGRGRLVIAEYLNRNFRSKVDVYHTSDAYIYLDTPALTMQFFRQENVNLLPEDDICSLANKRDEKVKPRLVILRFEDFNALNCRIKDKLKLLTMSLPLSFDLLTYVNQRGFLPSKLKNTLLLFQIED